MLSAYMILHVDDDFLEDAIKSIYQFVDEIVIVDGAYEWVAPFLIDMGIDPTRSFESTHTILEKYKDKIKYHCGLWRDEVHKRMFGFENCSGDVVIRIDADEIFQFDHDAFQEFLRSDYSLAELELPFMATPTLERIPPDYPGIPKQAAFFKRASISAAEHCSYLWLVLTAEEREKLPPAEWRKLFSKPIVRAAHLTQFRTPKTSTNRARYYNLQYVRVQKTIAWKPANWIEDPDLDPVQGVFQLFSSDDFTSWLHGHPIVSGFADMNDCGLRKVDFSSEISAQIELYYKRYKSSLLDLLDFQKNPRVVLSGIPSILALSEIESTTKLALEFNLPLESAYVDVDCLTSAQIGHVKNNRFRVVSEVNDRRLFIEIDRPREPEYYYRMQAVVCCEFRNGAHQGKLINCKIS